MANPGSTEAKRLGCTCPVLDNAYGQGAIIDGKVDPNQWFTDPDCPIHTDARRLRAESGGEVQSGGDASVEAVTGDASNHPDASSLDNEPARKTGDPS